MEEPAPQSSRLGEAGFIDSQRESAGGNGCTAQTSADAPSAESATERPFFSAWIHSALAYVPSVARRYLGCGLPFEELMGAGNLGLVEAAIRFDPSRNVKFVTYADWWIRKAILTAIEEQSGPVRLPRYRQEQLRMLHDARANLRHANGREPTPVEIARVTGLGIDDVVRLLSLGRQVVSLEQPASGGDGEKLVRDTLVVEGIGPREILLHNDEAFRLRRFVAGLAVRERAVLVLRYGLYGSQPLTLREVGRELGISRERVRQIEHRALLHLRRLLKTG